MTDIAKRSITIRFSLLACLGVPLSALAQEQVEGEKVKAPAADAPLPRISAYSTIDESRRAFDRWVHSEAMAAGVGVAIVSAKETVEDDGFIAIGSVLRARGSCAPVVRFLTALGNEPFCTLSELELQPDGLSPPIWSATVSVRKWHGRGEEGQEESERWRALKGPSSESVDLAVRERPGSPPRKARIARVLLPIDGDFATLIGESQNPHHGREFCKQIWGEEGVHPFRGEWTLFLRPTVNPKRKDGSADFRVGLTEQHTRRAKRSTENGRTPARVAD